MTISLKEYSATFSLATIMAFRMLGLFMILPIFAVAAPQLYHANAQLIGIALGIYGFTQGCLQIPFGMLSDKIGRKPIITLGLVLFALGSIIAALSSNIYLLIIGRACQGAGAIGSTTLALLADLTRDENRSKAMAIMGLAIGCSFSLAMILGPLINAWFHLAGIFWCTAGLAIIGLLLLHISIPTPPRILFHRNVETVNLKSVLKDPQLMRLNFGIFSLHATLTALFIGIPILLNSALKLTELQQAIFYLLVLAIAFLLMIPFMIIAEKKQQLKLIFIGAIGLLSCSQFCLLWQHQHILVISIMLLFFFTAFTFLEASLPSWISKIAPINIKGAAMGVYSSAQFLGIFCGGVIGGWLYSHFALNGILLFTTILPLLWLLLTLHLASPPYLTTLLLPLKRFCEQDPLLLSQQLSQITAIAEVAIKVEEGLVYLKIKQQLMTKDELPKQLERSNLLHLEWQ